MDKPATIPPSFFSFFRRRAPVELEKDEFGAIRPFSNDAIQLDLEGPAALIGDNPFAVVGGTGAVWIRAKEQPGSVRLTATHPVFGKKTSANCGGCGCSRSGLKPHASVGRGPVRKPHYFPFGVWALTIPLPSRIVRI